MARGPWAGAEPPVEEVSLKIHCLPGRLRVLSYGVMLDVPAHRVVFITRRLAAHRREIGTRRGTRALTCQKQAVFALAWFRDRPDIARLGKGAGISQATAYRYLGEAIEVVAARAPGSALAAPALHRIPAHRIIAAGLTLIALGDGSLIAAARTGWGLPACVALAR